MALTHEVTLTLADGTQVDTWSQYDLTLDMLRPGSAWTFTLYKSKERNSTWDVLRRKALVGERILVHVDGACQLNGRIEDRIENVTAQGQSLTITGRDLAGPAIDADAEPTIQLRGSTLEDALFALFKDIDVDMRLLDGAAAAMCQQLRDKRRQTKLKPPKRKSKVDLFRIKPGDKIWDTAKKLCRKSGYMMWTAPYPDDDPPGIGLVVAKPNESEDASYALYRYEENGFLKSNILSSTYSVSMSGVPTDVTAFGHTALGDGSDARSKDVVFNGGLQHPLVASKLIPLPRFLHVDNARSKAAATREAERVIADAMTNFRVFEATVQGHGQIVQGQRRTFAVNTIMFVSDEVHGVEEKMLVTSVKMHGSRNAGGGGGQTTQLHMVPVGAIKIIPEDDDTPAVKKASGFAPREETPYAFLPYDYIQRRRL